jgi:pyruvate/2-oxoglutarate dehydrogenase complex dihydrolipoamide dehydrogenase (E3) component
MVVIGAGAIGVEFADFWNAFGIEVTIIEFMPRVLPIEDEDASRTLARSLRKKGIKLWTGTRTAGIQVSGKQATTSYTTPDGKDGHISSDRVLLAVGVRANIEGTPRSSLRAGAPIMMGPAIEVSSWRSWGALAVIPSDGPRRPDGFAGPRGRSS